MSSEKQKIDKTSDGIARFKDHASVIQSAITSMGIFLAGAWAVWLFVVESPAQLAEADLKIKQTALYKAPTVIVDLNAQPMHVAEVNDEELDVSVTLDNVGNQLVELDFRDHPPIEIGRLNSAGKNSFPINSSAPLAAVGDPPFIGHLTLAPNSKMTLHTLIPISGPGTYLVQFYADAPKSDGLPPRKYYGNKLIAVAK